MEPKTLQALKEAIAHWERLRNEFDKEEPKELPNAYSCPLCITFLLSGELLKGELSEIDRDDCRGCPIFEKTGSKYCFNTPFGHASSAWHRKDKVAWLEYNTKMVEFLKSLLPNEE